MSFLMELSFFARVDVPMKKPALSLLEKAAAGRNCSQGVEYMNAVNISKR